MRLLTLVEEKVQCLSECDAVSKRALQKEARRNEIIEAGLQEFAAQGFTGTRLDAVAERAGVGKGTIYLYFDSKESLFEEVVRKNLFPARDDLKSLYDEFTGSSEELLKEHLQHMYFIIGKEKIPELLAMVLGEGSRFPQLTDFFFKEMIDRNKKLTESIIQQGVERGEFKDVGLANYTQILISPIIMSALWRLQFNEYDPINMDEYAKTHIDFMLNGLRV